MRGSAFGPGISSASAHTIASARSGDLLAHPRLPSRHLHVAATPQRRQEPLFRRTRHVPLPNKKAGIAPGLTQFSSLTG
jgi:hypothetical protein